MNLQNARTQEEFPLVKAHPGWMAFGLQNLPWILKVG